MSIVRPLALARAFFAAAIPLTASLAGCDGPAHPNPPLKVAIAGNDAAGIATRGDDVVFTFTLTNTSGSDITNTSINFAGDSTSSGAAPPLRTKSITCSAQGGTCPAIHAPFVDPGTLAAGAALTFTVTTTVVDDYGGQVSEEFFFYAGNRAGSASATAHVTLHDSRDGQYDIFSTSGRRTAALVTFADGAATLRDLAGSAPTPFTPDGAGFAFADGSRFLTLPDMLVGRHDFGAGPETFLGGRVIDASLSDLDGLAFTLFTSDAADGATPATAVHAATIDAGTLTICMDAMPQASGSCPSASQWLYALSVDGTTFTATDSQHGDTIVFQVLDSGHARYLLRAERTGGANHFAIGVPTAAPSTDTRQFLGNAAGHWSLVQLALDGYATTSSMDHGVFLPFGPNAALQQVAGGPAGLLRTVRASDGATLLVAGSEAMAVQIGAAGELDLLAHVGTP